MLCCKKEANNKTRFSQIIIRTKLKFLPFLYISKGTESKTDLFVCNAVKIKMLMFELVYRSYKNSLTTCVREMT